MLRISFLMFSICSSRPGRPCTILSCGTNRSMTSTLSPNERMRATAAESASNEKPGHVSTMDSAPHCLTSRKLLSVQNSGTSRTPSFMKFVACAILFVRMSQVERRRSGNHNFPSARYDASY